LAQGLENRVGFCHGDALAIPCVEKKVGRWPIHRPKKKERDKDMMNIAESLDINLY
jgi:hypothetical protein